MVNPTKEPDLDYLSKTELESINKTIAELKGKSREQIEGYLYEEVYHRVLSTVGKTIFSCGYSDVCRCN